MNISLFNKWTYFLLLFFFKRTPLKIFFYISHLYVITFLILGWFRHVWSQKNTRKKLHKNLRFVFRKTKKGEKNSRIKKWTPQRPLDSGLWGWFNRWNTKLKRTKWTLNGPNRDVIANVPLWTGKFLQGCTRSSFRGGNHIFF